jgi:hypothetical protein
MPCHFRLTAHDRWLSYAKLPIRLENTPSALCSEQDRQARGAQAQYMVFKSPGTICRVPIPNLQLEPDGLKAWVIYDGHAETVTMEEQTAFT